MASNRKKWIIKDLSGKVTGPLETEEVLDLIRRGEITGDESVAVYPRTQWMPITKTTEFYDKLLEALEFPDKQEPDRVSHGSVSQSKRSNVEKVKTTTRNSSKPKAKSQNSAEPPDGGKVYELKKRDVVLKKEVQKKSVLPIFIILLAIVVIFFFIIDTPGGSGEAIRLRAPQKNHRPLPTEAIKKLMVSADAQFFYDSTSSLIAAQDAYIQAAEGDDKNITALMMLCLTYEALWPVSYQDQNDLKAITTVVQLASKINPASEEVAVCRAVDLHIRGKTQEATSIVDAMIATLGSTKNPSAPAYYIKALLMEKSKEYQAGAGYIQNAVQIWPQWLKGFVTAGRLLEKSGQQAEAARVLSQVLAINTKHAEALVLLGQLEHRFFKNADQAEQLFSRVINAQDFVARGIESKAYLGLAEISLERGDSRAALDYAKKSYQLSASQQQAAAIILQLDGKKGLLETKRGDRQLIYEGDQLFREGDYNGAQAYYKQAYEMNKKNGLAAMRAAEALWQLSLTSEAIDWLNKAILAEPKLIEAYTLLADYYSQRFNFQAAGQVLSTASQIDAKNYRIFRGYAQLEIRRNSAQSALRFAEQAIQLYEADVESYVVIAQASAVLGDYAKALKAAMKAVELDVSNKQAQIILAESIQGAQGAKQAIDYLMRLTEAYPHITEFRLALGQVYSRNQNYQMAENIFEQVIRLEEKPKKALIERGLARQKQQKYQLAVNDFYQAAVLDPADVEPLYLAGILFLETKKPAQARTEFMRAMRVNKEYPRLYYFLGLAALEAGDELQAIELGKQEALRNPNLADPYILLARAYYKQNQWGMCAQEYQKALKLRPLGTDIMVKMAECYRLGNNLEAAASIIGIAGQQESGNPNVWKEQGEIFAAKGEKIRAIEAYEQYLVLAPNAIDADAVRSKISTLSR